MTCSWRVPDQRTALNPAPGLSWLRPSTQEGATKCYSQMGLNGELCSSLSRSQLRQSESGILRTQISFPASAHPGSCQGQTPWAPQRTRARAPSAGLQGKLPRAAPRPQTHSISAPAMKQPGFEEMRTALLTASLAQISFITSVNSAFSCLDRVFT